MTDTLTALITCLADGHFHSGEALGRKIGISRSAVWKCLKQLPDHGLSFVAVKGRGYKLNVPLELLDKSSIEATSGHNIELFPFIDSTSHYLKQQAELGVPSGRVCIAEAQTDGKGRRGRKWHSPFGSNVYLSLLWRFNDGMTGLGGLSLAVAVALMRAFREGGANRLGIKWPNDIICDNGKVAGILVDVAGESSGPCYAVVGIGINYGMSDVNTDIVEQAWSALKNEGIAIGRNEMVGILLKHLFATMNEYQSKGFAPFRDEWLNYDLYRDRHITLKSASGDVTGVERGCDQNGLLIIERDGELVRYAAGDVSLRPTAR